VSIGDLRERTTGDLEQTVGELRRELWKARFDNHANQLDDTSKIRKLKTQIAQALTLLTERKRAEKKAK
jgi:large subunit ribosomal protein L29